MATKLARKNIILFGRDGSADNFNQFGSRAGGAAVATKDVETIQALTAYLAGIQGGLLPGSKAPFMQDFNGLFYVFSYASAYTLQEGIPEWNTSTPYFIGSIVKKTGTFELYGSLTDDNSGHALPSQVNSAFWKYLGELGNIGTSGNGDVADVKYTSRSTPPTGWLVADGSAVSRVTYSSLFAAISTQYGSGDSVTTFNLPNVQGVFIRGLDGGRGLDSGRVLGSFQLDQFQTHWHETRQQGQVGNLNDAGGAPNVTGTPFSDTTSHEAAARDPRETGNGIPARAGSETRPMNIALLPIIKY